MRALVEALEVTRYVGHMPLKYFFRNSVYRLNVFPAFFGAALAPETPMRVGIGHRVVDRYFLIFFDVAKRHKGLRAGNGGVGVAGVIEVPKGGLSRVDPDVPPHSKPGGHGLRASLGLTDRLHIFALYILNALTFAYVFTGKDPLAVECAFEDFDLLHMRPWYLFTDFSQERSISRYPGTKARASCRRGDSTGQTRRPMRGGSRL